jgi:hypothetical protein
MRTLCFTSLLFLIGLTIHYLFKDNAVQEVWDRYYFLWDKLKDLLLFVGYLVFIPKDKKEVRFSIKAISGFCIIRIVWEFYEIGTDYIYASNYRVIDIMFTLLLLVISSVWVKSNMRNGKKGSFNMGFRRNTRVQHDRNFDHF